MVVLLMVTTTIIAVTMISSAYAANILAVFPHHGFSHYHSVLPYLQELANRGHNLTLISNYPSEHPNITDISIKGSMPIYNNKKDIRLDEPKNDILFSIDAVRSFYVNGKVIQAMFTVDSVKQLLSGPSKYDLLITEHFNSELSLAFASKFDVPFILMSSCDLLPWNQHAVGQPQELAIKPTTLSTLSPKMNLYDRVMNLIANTLQLFGYLYFCRKRDEEIIKQQLDTDVSLDKLTLNASLIFVNTHYTMFEPIPLVPAVVEIGGIHIRPATPLSVVSIFLYHAK